MKKKSATNTSKPVVNYDCYASHEFQAIDITPRMHYTANGLGLSGVAQQAPKYLLFCRRCGQVRAL